MSVLIGKWEILILIFWIRGWRAVGFKDFCCVVKIDTEWFDLLKMVKLFEKLAAKVDVYLVKVMSLVHVVSKLRAYISIVLLIRKNNSEYLKMISRWRFLFWRRWLIKGEFVICWLHLVDYVCLTSRIKIVKVEIRLKLDIE